MTSADGRGRGGRTPVDDAIKARVVQLAREGMSRNAVAREVGIAPRTVSRICDAAEPPVTFDRTQTAAAVAAHSIDAKAERARLSRRLLAEAHELLDLSKAPHEITHWDKDGVLHRAIIDRPIAADRQRYMIALGVATDKHIALERHDGADLELSAVDAWILDRVGGTYPASLQ